MYGIGFKEGDSLFWDGVKATSRVLGMAFWGLEWFRRTRLRKLSPSLSKKISLCLYLSSPLAFYLSRPARLGKQGALKDPSKIYDVGAAEGLGAASGSQVVHSHLWLYCN